MNKYLLQIVIFVLIAGFALYVLNCYGERINEENFYSFGNTFRGGLMGENGDDGNGNGNGEGDEVLRNLYRNMHNLEAVERNEIDQIHEFPGSSMGISQDKYILEQTYKEASRMQHQARQDIAKRRLPMHAQNLSPIGDSMNEYHYGNGQMEMDYDERILGIPSVPGNIHSYYHNY